MSSNNSNDLPIDTQSDKIPETGIKSTMGAIMEKLTGIKNYLSFVLSLISIVGVLLLAWFKGISVEMLLPSLLGVYILGRAGQKSVGMIAASRDPNADTRAVIQDLNGIKPPKIED